ncbi:MAG: AAA family ATPase [Planctomycetes bacterium]|nr:AAA family ATPase [Planctomycetota bacterium]
MSQSPSIQETARAQAEQVLAALQQRPHSFLVGIAGIPGSGKTTLCRMLRQMRPDFGIVPMDGYHLPRCQLDAEGLRRRGAPHTFDPVSFRRDIQRLRDTRVGVFPEFDHAEKDPRPNAIRITPDVPVIIIEGIYVLMRDWQVEPLLDLRVFLDCDLEVATNRLALRHLQTGLAATAAEGRQRALDNDRLNSLAILADGCRERADLVLRSTS